MNPAVAREGQRKAGRSHWLLGDAAAVPWRVATYWAHHSLHEHDRECKEPVAVLPMKAGEHGLRHTEVDTAVEPADCMVAHYMALEGRQTELDSCCHILPEQGQALAGADEGREASEPGADS